MAKLEKPRALLWRGDDPRVLIRQALDAIGADEYREAATSESAVDNSVVVAAGACGRLPTQVRVVIATKARSGTYTVGFLRDATSGPAPPDAVTNVKARALAAVERGRGPSFLAIAQEIGSQVVDLMALEDAVEALQRENKIHYHRGCWHPGRPPWERCN